MSRTWSPQQAAVFDWLANPSEDSRALVVLARAGTGKTTTIIEGVTRAPEKSIVLCAFNKRIATELSERLRHPGAVAKTLHALGCDAVRQAWKGTRVDSDRGWTLAEKAARAHAEANDLGACPDDVIESVSKIAGALKNADPLASTEDPAPAVALAHGLGLWPEVDAETLDASGWDRDTIAGVALKAFGASFERDGSMDFDDMLSLPVRLKMAHPIADLVVVDECQDMNAAQLALAQRLVRKGGRIVLVGDDRQAIYGFRGADSDSIARLTDELAATVLPLTVTYRCGSSIVERARRLVPDFEAAPGADAGTVEQWGIDRCMNEAIPGDAFLSRKNAPLAALCLRFLREGKPARIEGRDVAGTLVRLCQRWKSAKTAADLMFRLSDWKAAELGKLAKLRGPSVEARREYICDQHDTIVAVSDGCATVADVVVRLKEVFATDERNPRPSIVCSSIHRAKGLEWDRVFILEKTLYPGGSTEDREEQNLEYVAITRARKTLILIPAVA